jgi:sec-independent protein translocase protein TatA
MAQLIPLLAPPEGMEWVLLVAVVILLFGAGKLPDLARNAGRAMRIFKAETKELRDDKDEDRR